MENKFSIDRLQRLFERFFECFDGKERSEGFIPTTLERFKNFKKSGFDSSLLNMEKGKSDKKELIDEVIEILEESRAVNTKRLNELKILLNIYIEDCKTFKKNNIDKK